MNYQSKVKLSAIASLLFIQNCNLQYKEFRIGWLCSKYVQSTDVIVRDVAWRTIVASLEKQNTDFSIMAEFAVAPTLQHFPIFNVLANGFVIIIMFFILKSTLYIFT